MGIVKKQRIWSEERPDDYDKDGRIVSFGILPERGIGHSGEPVDGFSFYKVELDAVIDYAHIKSQLIESAFAQKDEFGFLMNAVNDLVKAIKTSDSFAAMKDKVGTKDLMAFDEFCEFRDLCAATAKNVMSYYDTEN